MSASSTAWCVCECVGLCVVRYDWLQLTGFSVIHDMTPHTTTYSPLYTDPYAAIAEEL
jgi:hypothetical protein